MKLFQNAILCMSLVALAACSSDPASTDPAQRSQSAAPADKKAPTKPGTLTSPSNTSWSVSLAWDAATDNSGSVSYRVKDNWGREISVAGTSVTWKYPT